MMLQSAIESSNKLSIFFSLLVLKMIDNDESGCVYGEKKTLKKEKVLFHVIAKV